MIKPNELRIGNWIYDFGDGDGQVKGIDADGYVLTSANDVYQPHETFRPIPLTEEWHNKFGVQKDVFDSFRYKLPDGIINFELTVVFQGDYVFIQQGGTIDADLISVWNKDLTKRDMFVH